MQKRFNKYKKKDFYKLEYFQIFEKLEKINAF